MIDESGRKIMTKFVCHEKNLKFQTYKNCLVAAQLENKINHLENFVFDIDNTNKIIKKS